MLTDGKSGLAARRRQGLRVALAVSVGFIVAVFSGAVVPFLAPLFAAQFLLGSLRPMPLAKTLGAALVIMLAGFVMMILTRILGERPAPFLLLLGLVYFLCFVAQQKGRGGPAVFLILVVAIIVPLLGILNDELANSILSILVAGVLGGTVLMWLAYALFPEAGAPVAETAPARRRGRIYWPALANTAILLTAVVICLTSDQLTAALVIPITVASLLGQLDFAATWKAAMGLVVVNLFGGLLASLAYAMLSLTPNLLAMFLILLIASLFLGGRAVAGPNQSKIYAGALTTFLILFGLGVSPLPGTAAEAFSTRLLYVLAALIYTIIALLLLRSVNASPSGGLVGAAGGRLTQAA